MATNGARRDALGCGVWLRVGLGEESATVGTDAGKTDETVAECGRD